MRILLLLLFNFFTTNVIAQFTIKDCPSGVMYRGYYYDFEYTIPCDQAKESYMIKVRSKEYRARIWRNDFQNPTACSCKFKHIYPRTAYLDSIVVVKLLKNGEVKDSLIFPIKKATTHLFLISKIRGHIEVKGSVITLSKEIVRSLEGLMVHPKIKGRHAARIYGYKWKYFRGRDKKTFEGNNKGYEIHRDFNDSQIQFSNLIRNAGAGDTIELYRIFADMLEIDDDVWLLKVTIKVI